MKFYTASDERFNPDGQLTVRNRVEKIFEHVKKRHDNIFDANDEIKRSPRSLALGQQLYVVMIIRVFGALDSFFILHDTKAAIEKEFSLMENGFKEEEKRALRIPFLVMDKSGFK